MAREQTSDRRRVARRRKEPQLVAARAANTDDAMRHDQICCRAYQLAEARGFAPGHELDDWLKAESEFDLRTVERH
ncbi:MAG: DUF2934 domain-containing protein [Pseudomonadales bacterium]|nr:DUF2934 domain-containing protein [Pseudomonadales bacterium]